MACGGGLTLAHAVRTVAVPHTLPQMADVRESPENLFDTSFDDRGRCVTNRGGGITTYNSTWETLQRDGQGNPAAAGSPPYLQGLGDGTCLVVRLVVRPPSTPVRTVRSCVHSVSLGVRLSVFTETEPPCATCDVIL